MKDNGYGWRKEYRALDIWLQMAHRKDEPAVFNPKQRPDIVVANFEPLSQSRAPDYSANREDIYLGDQLVVRGLLLANMHHASTPCTAVVVEASDDATLLYGVAIGHHRMRDLWFQVLTRKF